MTTRSSTNSAISQVARYLTRDDNLSVEQTFTARRIAHFALDTIQPEGSGFFSKQEAITEAIRYIRRELFSANPQDEQHRRRLAHELIRTWQARAKVTSPTARIYE